MAAGAPATHAADTKLAPGSSGNLTSGGVERITSQSARAVLEASLITAARSGVHLLGTT